MTLYSTVSEKFDSEIRKICFVQTLSDRYKMLADYFNVLVQTPDIWKNIPFAADILLMRVASILYCQIPERKQELLSAKYRPSEEEVRQELMLSYLEQILDELCTELNK